MMMKLAANDDDTMEEMTSVANSNSKALVAKDSQGEIDWTKEFDDDPVTFAMSEEADNAPVALALMAKSSTDSSNSEGIQKRKLKDHAIFDSGCLERVGYVAFGNDRKGGRITGKGTIKTSCIDDNVVKVHTDDNVADLLTKGFDLARFNSLVVNIGMMNP
ncbi:hypothetical protein Tco_1321577 [Tanacetum coccineum]